MEGQWTSWTLKHSCKGFDKDYFPNIHTLTLIMVTIPITSCECERFFSLLRLLKSTIRTTMTEVRLNGLALMKYHQDIKLDPDDKARVLQFLDMLSWISFALCTHAGSAPATASHALGHPCLVSLLFMASLCSTLILYLPVHIGLGCRLLQWHNWSTEEDGDWLPR